MTNYEVWDLFTSESVGEGHPDKVCDQISDRILTEILKQDKKARVACETAAFDNTIIIGGEITTTAKVDYEALARDVLKNIGYNDPEFGIDYKTCEVLLKLNTQSPDINQGVDLSDGDVGAGDQGIMFGYAVNETEELMPLAITIAHKLVRRAAELRKSGAFKWAKPDMKSQVTVDYSDVTPRIHTVLMSVQHDKDYVKEEFTKYIKEEIMDVIAKEHNLNTDFKVLINPTGKFVIGGPKGDAGLTGRKIIVDTYGGSARHGGGAFSGKDPSKVDRSAAYMARYVAKNIVAAGLATKAEIQLSYAIGIKEPISILVDTFGTHKINEHEIIKRIWENFDLTPGGIIKQLGLLDVNYFETSKYGHFGRHDLNLPWERLDKVDSLKNKKK